MTPEDLAGIAGRAYRHMQPWTPAQIGGALADPFALCMAEPGGFVLGRVVAGEAEVFALAVDPECQRQGIARRLLAAFESGAQARAAEAVFLEVAAGNAPAIALYSGCGYAESGRRKGYYAQPGGARDDALLMRKALT